MLDDHENKLVDTKHCTYITQTVPLFYTGNQPQNNSTENSFQAGISFLPSSRSLNLPLKNMRILFLWMLYMYFLPLYIDEQNWREIQKN